eukprot:955586-Rhodomonas_salina.1
MRERTASELVQRVAQWCGREKGERGKREREEGEAADRLPSLRCCWRAGASTALKACPPASHHPLTQHYCP